MKAKYEWEQFTRTGKITDYLTFKVKEVKAEDIGEEKREQAGEQMYAGFRYSDGNGNQNDTCR